MIVTHGGGETPSLAGIRGTHSVPRSGHGMRCAGGIVAYNLGSIVDCGLVPRATHSITRRIYRPYQNCPWLDLYRTGSLAPLMPGLISCSNCGGQVFGILTTTTPLKVDTCPNCGGPEFERLE